MLTGLSQNFTLQNGSFTFTEGKEKAGDNVSFMLAFYNKTRRYTPEYTPGLLTLVQKSVSTVQQIQTLLLGRLKKSLSKYLPVTLITGLDIYRTDQREFAISLSYTYTEDNSEDTVVQFI